MLNGYTNFKWYDFGVVKGFDVVGKHLYVQNTKGDKRKISIYKYRTSIERIKNKINEFKGQHCRLRVSQNTAKWPKKIWFSDIEVA